MDVGTLTKLIGTQRGSKNTDQIYLYFGAEGLPGTDTEPLYLHTGLGTIPLEEGDYNFKIIKSGVYAVHTQIFNGSARMHINHVNPVSNASNALSAMYQQVIDILLEDKNLVPVKFYQGDTVEIRGEAGVYTNVSILLWRL